MSSGVVTFDANGRIILSVDGTGGVFIQRIVLPRDAGPTTYNYPALAGMTLLVLQVNGAAFSWSVNYNSGYPSLVINRSAYNIGNDYGAQLELLIFAQ